MKEVQETCVSYVAGDTGPAGGIIIKNKNGVCVEAAPVDAGVAAWHDAGRLCQEFSHNGYSDWRLPSPEELNIFAHTTRICLREKEKVLQTSETLIHWSDQHKGGTAVAVVTQENEDYYEPLYHYPMGGTSGGYHKSKNGPWRGDYKEFPVTHILPVRPVHDFGENNERL